MVSGIILQHYSFVFVFMFINIFNWIINVMQIKHLVRTTRFLINPSLESKIIQNFYISF